MKFNRYFSAKNSPCVRNRNSREFQTALSVSLSLCNLKFCSGTGLDRKFGDRPSAAETLHETSTCSRHARRYRGMKTCGLLPFRPADPHDRGRTSPDSRRMPPAALWCQARPRVCQSKAHRSHSLTTDGMSACPDTPAEKTAYTASARKLARRPDAYPYNDEDPPKAGLHRSLPTGTLKFQACLVLLGVPFSRAFALSLGDRLANLRR